MKKEVIIWVIALLVALLSLAGAACRPKAAVFEVSSLDVAPAEAGVGEEVAITATIENVGEAEGTYTAKLAINGVEEQTKDIPVGPGAVATATFTLIRDEAGTYNLQVDGLTETLIVLQPATFQVSPLTITPAEAGVGEIVTVMAEAENLGDVEGIYTASLKIDGVEAETKEIWVGPGMKRKMSFGVKKDEAGTYNLEIGGQSETLTVKQGFYRNSTYGLSITYPASWIREETGGQRPIVEISSPLEFPKVRLFLGYLPEVISLEEWAASFKESLEGITGFEIISGGEVSLAGTTTGYETVFTIPQEGGEVKYKHVGIIRGTQVLEILALAPSPDFDANLSSIDKVIHSLRLGEPRPFGVPRQESLILSDNGPQTLDPTQARETASMKYISEIFSGLVTLDKELHVVPDMAERWEISGDGKVYTFHLRQGVRFHDGKEVKAGAFKYSLEYACAPETESPTAETYLGDIVGVKEVLEGKAKEISGIKVIDDYTLQITIDAPKAYFLAKLTHAPAVFLDRANVESGKDWWRKPNGAGPFRLNEWQEEELLILERNELYYGEPAKVNYVVFRLWGGVPIRMYETGEIDIAPIYLTDIERVLDPSNPLHGELVTTPQLLLRYISFNATKPPFDDVKVRQAFNHAVDKDKLIEVVYKGTVKRAEGILPPGMPGYNKDVKGLSFDVDKAKELIRQSRYGDVSRLPPIVFTASGRGEIEDLDAALIDMWRQNLGVEVAVRQLEPETYFYMLKEEKNEIFGSGWIADYPDPQNFLDILFYSGGEENTAEYSNPEVDALLEQARVEQDATARMRLYREGEQLIISDAACLPLFFEADYTLVKPYVKGFVSTPMPIPSLRFVSLETPPAILTQAKITALSSMAEVEFPASLTFSLEAESDAVITDITLQYRVKKISYATLISEARPEFTPSPRAQTSWTWDMRKASLPPGAEVEFRWIIENDAGNREETAWDSIGFDDHRYGWRSLEGDKVTLFWYSGDQSFAQELMDAALEALEKLARDTGAELEQPAKIYIYASYEELRGAMVNPQEWTGGAAFTKYGIVVIGIDVDNLAWGKRTVAHELAHLVNYQMTFNPYGDLPTWLSEGLAMYAEGELTPGHWSVLNQAISEDRLISVQSLSSSFPAAAEEAGLSYAQSYSLIDFLIREYGRDKMLQLLRVFKQGSSYDDALLEVYGFDQDGLDALWLQSLGLEPHREAGALASAR
jgi:oligopeptide transport system substrate-binding protein